MKKETGFHVNVEEAVKQYADMVYRLALLNTTGEAEAEDVFQDVFLKLLKYQESIISEEHLKAWLLRVTINQCKSAVISIWNKRRVSMDSLPEAAEEKEEKDYSDIYEEVRRLPSKYRAVIHLFYFEELSVKEIAQVLKKKEATVKTQLARGRELLGEKLKEEYGYEK